MVCSTVPSAVNTSPNLPSRAWPAGSGQALARPLRLLDVSAWTAAAASRQLKNRSTIAVSSVSGQPVIALTSGHKPRALVGSWMGMPSPPRSARETRGGALVGGHVVGHPVLPGLD